MRPARRIHDLPPYLFASLDRKISEAKAKGVDVISFAIGDPDQPTPPHIVQAAQAALADPTNHQYPSYSGLPQMREAVAAFYERRFGVRLDPHTQVLPLIGSKEGIANLATAMVDPGDTVLTCDPGYPVYAISTMLAGGRAVPVALREEKDYLPDFSQIPSPEGAEPKILWLNYPSNPTSAVCGQEVLQEAVDYCKSHDLLLAHDAAYSEITYDGFVAPSVLQAAGASESAIEFGSMSKTYNMTGWRVGWAAGSPEAIEALGRVKTNIDSGIFNALQKAAITGLAGPQDIVLEMIEIYRRRRDTVVSALRSCGFDVTVPRGALYVWVRVPEGQTSAGFSEHLLESSGVVVAPGSGYGSNGEGYIRFSLTIADDRLQEGMERVASALRSMR